MFCSACSSLVDHNANFCKGCGKGTFFYLKYSYSLVFIKVSNNDKHVRRHCYKLPDYLCKSWHFDRLTNHKRCKTSWARDKGHCTKNGGFRASSVFLLHDVPFQMQITTADQLVSFVLPWVNFVLPWVNFVLPSDNIVVPWLFVLPWQLWATVVLFTSVSVCGSVPTAAHSDDGRRQKVNPGGITEKKKKKE